MLKQSRGQKEERETAKKAMGKPLRSLGKTGASFLLMVLAAVGAVAEPAITVRVSLTAPDQAKYQHFMKGKVITDRLHYESSDLDSSPVLDTILITKALTLGGLPYTFEFVEVPNSERERSLLLKGEIMIAGTSQWDFFARENADLLFQSDVIVPDGAFEKGLYTTKANLTRLQVHEVKDLSVLTCTSNPSWRVDWETLQNLGFKKLVAGPTIPLMFRLVDAGRVDVTVQSFSGNPDMSIQSEGVTLYPIPGVKVLLKGSRHFVVNKQLPQAARVFEALQRGLALMKKAGEIQRALVESGFFNLRVRDWRVLRVQ